MLVTASIPTKFSSIDKDQQVGYRLCGLRMHRGQSLLRTIALLWTACAANV